MYGHSDHSVAALPDFTASSVVTKLSLMNINESPITKRQLGIALLIIGVVGFFAILLIDVIDVGRQGGIGPAQSLALTILVLVALVGLSLIPLGDAPA